MHQTSCSRCGGALITGTLGGFLQFSTRESLEAAGVWSHIREISKQNLESRSEPRELRMDLKRGSRWFHA